MTDASRTGMVTLVGAGPGDPGLLTLAGKAALEQADVVLFDRLAGQEILSSISNNAERIDVGKNKGCHPVPQDEINRLLLALAREGKRVVRLKGGDPFLFGRGAEELTALAAAGIRCRVIPGVTSALAAPACAGIPVTHRGLASSVHILTGHGKDGGRPDIAYKELAAIRGTLVFLMGLTAITEITAGLLAVGMDPATPAALVENGARAGQRRLDGTLGTIAGVAAKEQARSPAVLVIGQVCALAGKFDFSAQLPLAGRRVLAATSRSTAGRLAAGLRGLGCCVDEFHAVRMEPAALPDGFWTDLPEYGWIVLTSAFGAELFFKLLMERGADVRSLAKAKFAAVGSQTAKALRSYGVLADFVPDVFDGAALARGLAERLRPDEKILLFRAAEGAGDLPRILESAGARVTDVAAYATLSLPLDAETLQNLRAGRYGAVTFTSSSAVRSLAASAGEVDFSSIPALCIGPQTAAAARAAGFAVTVSPVASVDGMVEAFLAFCKNRSPV